MARHNDGAAERWRAAGRAPPPGPALRLSRTPSPPLSAVAARPAEEDLAVALEWLERALEGNRGASGEEAPVSKTIVEVLRGIVMFTRDTEDPGGILSILEPMMEALAQIQQRRMPGGAFIDTPVGISPDSGVRDLSLLPMHAHATPFSHPSLTPRCTRTSPPSPVTLDSYLNDVDLLVNKAGLPANVPRDVRRDEGLDEEEGEEEEENAAAAPAAAPAALDNMLEF